MIETVEDGVEFIEERFWAHYERNERLRDALAGKDRVILLDVTDGPSYHIVVQDGEIHEARPGSAEDPDVRVTASRDDLLAVLNGELHPVKAYLTRRVKVSAPMRDILLVRSFL